MAAHIDAVEQADRVVPNWFALSDPPQLAVHRVALLHPKPAEPEPNRQSYFLGRAGKDWMIRRFTSARLFPHQRGAADHAGDDQIRIVGSSAIGVDQRIFRFFAFMRAR